jgi:Ala-tRNA(Pro) deacylase
MKRRQQRGHAHFVRCAGRESWDNRGTKNLSRSAAVCRPEDLTKPPTEKDGAWDYQSEVLQSSPKIIGFREKPMDNPILRAIRELLGREGVAYREVQHAPTFTSEQSAQARGEDVRIGGKALLMKTDQVFRLFVLSAALKIDSAAIKRHFQIKKLRFASADELRDLTGLVPGSVPPFGAPILPFELFADPSVFENDKIAFNAGSLTDSIILPVEDYQRVAQPMVFRFTAPADGG